LQVVPEAQQAPLQQTPESTAPAGGVHGSPLVGRHWPASMSQTSQASHGGSQSARAMQATPSHVSSGPQQAPLQQVPVSGSPPSGVQAPALTGSQVCSAASQAKQVGQPRLAHRPDPPQMPQSPQSASTQHSVWQAQAQATWSKA
jgi:hypothetical protein